MTNALIAPMMFLPVVLRELSVTARRPQTYSRRMRAALLAMVAGLGVLVYLFQLPVGEQGRMLFSVLSTLAFAYALFAGVRSTSDCLSAEKREGTLGLLFLTDLKGYDLVLGKLVSSSVTSLYALLAMMPVLSLAMLLGGVGGREIGLIALILLNTLFFSLAAGVFVSSVSRVDRKALTGTLGLILLVTLGPYPVAYYYTYGLGPEIGSLDPTFLTPSPSYAFGLVTPTTGSKLMIDLILASVAVTHVLGWSLLGLAAVILPRTFRDRPAGVRRLRWRERWQQWSYGNSAARKAFRERLLDLNPFCWLAGRDRLKANYVWLFLGLLGCLWYFAYTQQPEIILDWQSSAWWVFFLCGFFKVWLTSEVCARLAEDRRCGALELLLASPLTLEEIARGQGLALRRQFGKPVGLVLVAAILMLWAGLRTGSDSATQTEAIVLFAAGIILVVADMVTLKWVGMWLALTSPNPNRALIATLSRVLCLPWILFGLLYFTVRFVNEVVMQRPPDQSRIFWIGCWFAIGLGMDLLYGGWARRNVLRDFRNVSAQRFEVDTRKTRASVGIRFLKDVIAAVGTRRTARRGAAPRNLLRRYWWIWATAAVTIVLGAWFAWFRLSLARQVEARLAAIRDARWPASLAEFSQWNTPVPPAENAALKILEAASAVAVNSAVVNQVQSLDRQVALTPEQRLSFTRILSNNAVALRLVHQASTLSRSRYPIDWSNNLVFGFSGLNQAHQLMPLLKAEAVMLSDSGDPAGAIESIIVLFRLAHTLSEEPFLAAQWIRHWNQGTTCSTLERLLNQHALRAADLQRLQELAVRAQGEPDFTRVLAGQRALDADAFNAPLNRFLQRWASPGWNLRGPQQVSLIGLVSALLHASGITEKDFLFYLEAMEQWMTVSRLAYPEKLARTKALEKRVQEQLAARPLFVYSRQLFASRLVLETTRAERLASLRAAQTALAVEQYRREHEGGLPDKLDELVPKFLEVIPKDPFDGQPLRYKRLEVGYAVYSVGADQKDDGAVLQSTGKRRPSARDIAFIVER